MILDIILLIIFIGWIILYIKNKNAIKVLPYLLMFFITPFYNLLDQKVFVEIFGCGCVPVAQTNMLNIDFNANDLRRLVYSVIATAVFVLGLFLSKKIEGKKKKTIYIITILVFNILLALKICQMYMWA